jgi:exo-1,4-beta-D-glucosaminidase
MGLWQEVYLLQRAVGVASHTWKPVTFTPGKFADLNLSQPRLWWPWEMGMQNLYEMKIEFRINGQVSDSQ